MTVLKAAKPTVLTFILLVCATLHSQTTTHNAQGTDCLEPVLSGYGQPGAETLKGWPAGSTVHVYTRGDAVSKDPALAAQYATKAASSGDDTGELVLGELHESGSGVVQDQNMAAQMYSAAARQHNFVATYRLALLYQNGSGVEQNDRTAFEWFYEAAKSALPAAQEALGESYNLGRGVAVDQQKAYEWTSLAAKNGNATAQARLDVLRSMLDPDTLHAANADIATATRTHLNSKKP